MNLNKKTGFRRLWLSELSRNRSGRTNAGVGAVEEEAHNEQNGHSACRGNQPERKHALSPAASPGHGRCAIRVAIGNSTVGIWGLLAAHG